jgi:hypothetical protein
MNSGLMGVWSFHRNDIPPFMWGIALIRDDFMGVQIFYPPEYRVAHPMKAEGEMSSPHCIAGEVVKLRLASVARAFSAVSQCHGPDLGSQSTAWG